MGFALLTALCAQIRIPLGFTPVPITGQTFAVLLSGAVLGSRMGAASQLLYVLMGAAGAPFYAGGTGGWEYATGATMGYLLGFVAAAYAVGYLAEHRQDRRFATSIGAFLTGNLVIYALGVPLAHVQPVLGSGRRSRQGPGAFHNRRHHQDPAGRRRHARCLETGRRPLNPPPNQ